MPCAWHLASRPDTSPVLNNFHLKDYTPAPLCDGMIRVRNRWLSVDPYMRGRMNEGAGHYPPFVLDMPLEGGAVGEVVESRASGFKSGDMVLHMLGWRDEAVMPATEAERVADGHVPRSYLGLLGITGATAYFALTRTARIEPGQTLFVSAAAGAVGSAVVQMARIMGLRVIASAGGADKCAWVRGLGADFVIDYKAGELLDQLRHAAPDGIDICFDNVGGDHLDAAIAVARERARFVLCGMIGSYNDGSPATLRYMMRIIQARLSLQGFSLEDYFTEIPVFREKMQEWIENGLILASETIVDGLEATPEAFLSLFSGGNKGKMLVRL